MCLSPKIWQFEIIFGGKLQFQALVHSITQKQASSISMEVKLLMRIQRFPFCSSWVPPRMPVPSFYMWSLIVDFHVVVFNLTLLTDLNRTLSHATHVRLKPTVIINKICIRTSGFKARRYIKRNPFINFSPNSFMLQEWRWKFIERPGLLEFEKLCFFLCNRSRCPTCCHFSCTGHVSKPFVTL